MSDWNEPIDDLLNLLPPISDPLDYTPAVWGPEAYRRSFEKFHYAEPCEAIAVRYPREWTFAMKVLRREYDFLVDSVMVDITSTHKNSDSTPGFPKFLRWPTEADYLAERGYCDYIVELNRVMSGARPRVLWYLFLKKEVLKTSKVNESDIRQIVCADPIYARIGCVFEEHQNQLMKERTATRMGQCGWSPFFGGFTRRIERLISHGNHCYVEFDWTRFDGTIPREVFHAVKTFRFSCLHPTYRTRENWEVYMWYLSNLYERYVLLPSGEVTIQRRGNPSGQVSTTMDNNMVNVFLQAFEYAYMWPDKTMDELCDDWTLCDSLVYGDDRLSTYPSLPDDYIPRVVAMYKDVFGMWVKEEKVKVASTPIGLTFCGFQVTSDLLPVPQACAKLLAALVKPVKKLQDLDALYGKLLCYRILSHNLDDDHDFKRYVLVALDVLARHIRSKGGEEPFYLTDRMLDVLWRGGPKKHYGE